jgi:hypothetical protein
MNAVPVVDEGLGTSAYVVDLGHGGPGELRELETGAGA